MSAFDSSLAGLNSSCLSTFGRPVTYKPAAGGSFAITGILDTSEAAQSREGPQAKIYGTLWIRLSDLTSPPLKGDIVTIGGVDYRVSKDPTDTRDGGGGTELYLRKI